MAVVGRVRRPGTDSSTLDPLAALRALEPVLVLTPSADGGISLRALRDTLSDLEDVREARLWALGDATRTSAVSTVLGALCARSYAASMAALERASIPF